MAGVRFGAREGRAAFRLGARRARGTGRLIVPGRGQPGEGRPPSALHGSTIRFFDPTIDAWRSTWIEPINARVRRFIGRSVGPDIVLLSDEEDPQLRWSFTEITPDSFTWRGETSLDGGESWTFDEEMVARRVGGRLPSSRR